MRAVHAWAGLFLAAGAVLHCTNDPTRIVLVLRADPSVEGALREVRINTRREGASTSTSVGVFPFPQYSLRQPDGEGHLVLQASNPDDGRRLFVSVEGSLTDGRSVRHLALTRYVPRRTVYLEIALEASCVGVTCTDAARETCLTGRCSVAIEQPTRESPPGTDAAVADRMDASEEDVANDALNEPGLDGFDVIVDAGKDAAVDMTAVGDAPSDIDAGSSDVASDAAPDLSPLDASAEAPPVSDATVDAELEVDARPPSDTSSDDAVLDLPDASDSAVDAVDVSDDRPRDAAVDVDPTRITAPRPISPTSTAIVTQLRPRLRVRLGPGSDGAEAEVCRDRACTMVVTRVALDGAGSPESIVELVPSSTLTAGMYFWRARGRVDGVSGTTWGPTWQVRIPARSAPRWGVGPTSNDFNGDGIDDLGVSGNAQASPVTVQYGRADRRLSMGIRTAEGYAAGAGDLNGDGFVDLVSGQTVYWGSVDGVRTSSTQALSGPTGDTGRGGDLNGDGYADVIYGDWMNNRIHSYHGGPSVSFARTLMTHSGITPPLPDSVGDFDGDGYGDVVAMGHNNPGCRVYFGSPAGLTDTFVDLNSAPTLRATVTGLFGSAEGVGDIDSDGYFDVACEVGFDDVGTRQTFCVWFGGATRDAYRFQCINALDGDRAIKFDGADLNLDGYSDVIVSRYGAMSGVIVYSGAPTGLNPASAYGASPTGVPVGSNNNIRAGDYDGDGYIDVLLGAYAGTMSAALFNERGTLSSTRFVLVSPSDRAYNIIY